MGREGGTVFSVIKRKKLTSEPVLPILIVKNLLRYTLNASDKEWRSFLYQEGKPVVYLAGIKPMR